MQEMLSKMQTLQEELDKNGFKDNAERVRQRYYDFQEPFMLMVVGEGNFGKSTLINSLFNRQVAPISRLPKTWKIDIYENHENEEALLYYQGEENPKIVSIEKAIEICDKEEIKAKNDDTWKSELYQVKWRFKSDWLNNILLIDTPGFSQFRSNSSFDYFNLFGTKGIQLQSFDGFEYYFYRADFVLWCIKATKLEDADTLSTLSKVSNEKTNIVGIITFMERIPSENWNDIKNKAEEIYGNYIKEFLFFTPKVESNKENINTIENIKNYITVNINTRLKELKDSSLLDFYSEELNSYSHSLEKSSDLYYKNIVKYYSLKDQVRQDVLSISQRILFEHTRVFNSIESSLEEKLNSIFLRCNNDPNIFKKLIEEEILNKHVLQRQIEPIYQLLRNEISNKKVPLLRQIVWDKIIISKRNIYSEEIISQDYYKENDIEPFYANQSLSVDFLFEEVEGFDFAVGGIAAAIGMLALGPIGLVAGALGFLFGQPKRDKIIDKTKEQIIGYLNRVSSETKKTTSNILNDFKTIISDKIDSSFREYNGKSSEKIIADFYQTDWVFSNKLLLNTKKSVIDCIDLNENYVTYFPILLKLDTAKCNLWDKNVNRLIQNEVKNIHNRVREKLLSIENEIRRLINENMLTDIELFNENFKYLEQSLTRSMYSNPFFSKPDYEEKLRYSNGLQVSGRHKIYTDELETIRFLITPKRFELEKLWDEKILELTWGAIKDKAYNYLTNNNSKLSPRKINDYCENKAEEVYKTIYKNIIKQTKVFAKKYSAILDSNDVLEEYLLPEIQSFIPSFQKLIDDEIMSDNSLASLKPIVIPDIPYYLSSILQDRLSGIINDLPQIENLIINRSVFGIRFLVLSLLLVLFLTYISLRFITLNQLLRFISNNYVIGIVLIFTLLIFYISSRLLVKRDIMKFVRSTFNDYVNRLNRNIQHNFKKKI